MIKVIISFMVLVVSSVSFASDNWEQIPDEALGVYLKAFHEKASLFKVNQSLLCDVHKRVVDYDGTESIEEMPNSRFSYRILKDFKLGYINREKDQPALFFESQDFNSLPTDQEYQYSSVEVETDATFDKIKSLTILSIQTFVKIESINVGNLIEPKFEDVSLTRTVEFRAVCRGLSLL